MRVFAHPFRIAADGSAATVEQWSTEQASQLAAGIISTLLGERVLAPDFGIEDPAGRGVDAAELVAAVELCEPDLTVTSVDTATTTGGRQPARLAVAWRPDEED